ncbi:MAG TPA: hypothetical protein PKN56_27025, partial [Leptospiraceae bacterium]|nr:hypothetical protein [Leptospiraceae bacterium]
VNSASSVRPYSSRLSNEELKNFHTECAEHTEKRKTSVNSASSVRPYSSRLSDEEIKRIHTESTEHTEKGKILRATLFFPLEQTLKETYAGY